MTYIFSSILVNEETRLRKMEKISQKKLCLSYIPALLLLIAHTTSALTKNLADKTSFSFARIFQDSVQSGQALK